MPPRSKSMKLEWHECHICTKIFSSRDLALHASFCSSENPFVYKNLSCCARVQHGFVVENTLIAVCLRNEGKLEFVPDRYHDDIVHMHPYTMRLLGLFIGRHALVNSSFCLIAWPDKSLPLTSVSFPSFTASRLVIGDDVETVAIKKLSSPLMKASEIQLNQLQQKKFLGEEFTHFCSRKLKDKALRVGNTTHLVYCGQPVTLQVVGVQDVAGKTSSAECQSSNSAEDIMQKLNALSLEDSNSRHFAIMCEETNIVLTNENQDKDDEPVIEEVIGGLDDKIALITQLIELRLAAPGTSVSGPLSEGSVLLYGPSGAGKSLLMRAIAARHRNMHVVLVRGSEVWSKYQGESEARLKRLVNAAVQKAPSLLLLDDLHILCPRRDRSTHDVEKRVVAALLKLLDSLAGRRVFVIAATSKRDELDPAIQRPGRLDREIEIGVPTVKQREQILSCQLSTTPVSATEIQEIASVAHGYLGCDLKALCNEAGRLAFNRDKSKPCIKSDDLKKALKVIKPSAMREVAIEVPSVTWADIGGQHELKHKLVQAVEWPLRHPEAFTRFGMRPPRGLLMYGPPGCSKTMIAKALARESGLNFVAIKGPELFSKWVGESERAVREVFRRARSVAPAIVFFDEIDALAGERGSGAGDVSDRVLAQLLTEIDGVDALQDVTIVAATNRPDRIDKALLRPGRLDRIVYVPLPDPKTRSEIFNIHFKRMPVDVDVEYLVEQTHKYSGAEISAVCHEAALCAMKEDINTTRINRQHFDEALTVVTPRITDTLITFYDDYAKKSRLRPV